MFETRATPYATRLNSWRAIKTYSVIRLGDGQESTISASDLEPFPRSQAIAEELTTDVASNPTIRAVWTVSYPIALAIRRLPLSRQG